jgi:heme/copper-type cytochrome/quinol oxidase subunit 2
MTRSSKLVILFLVFTVRLGAQSQSQPQAHVIEVLADHDSRYKIAGQTKPVITVTAGEPLLLRINAVRAKTRNRDGSIHGFTLLNSKTHKPVPGWDFLLQPGAQEFTINAPLEPGEYDVVCTVICSANHEGMTMKFIVLPAGG